MENAIVRYLILIAVVVVSMYVGGRIGSIAMPSGLASWLLVRVIEPSVELLPTYAMPLVYGSGREEDVRPWLSEESDQALQALYWRPFRGRQLWLFRHSLRELFALRAAVRQRARGKGLVPARANSCAVVGSAGGLLDRKDGAAIDAADVVIRVNAAPTPRSLRVHVGTRTSFYLNAYLPGAARASHSRGHSATVQTFPGSTVGRTPVVYYCQNLWVAECWARVSKDGADRVSPRLVTEAAARLALPVAKAPTSGFVALILALHLCNHTRAYGFGDGGRCARYYGPCRTNATEYRASGRRWHDWPREATWIRSSGLLGSAVQM